MSHLVQVCVETGIPVICLLSVFILVCLFYNVFLHPLRSYPGPLFARSSVIPSQRHQIIGDNHLWIQKLHRQYGPVVRYAPDMLSFISPSAWKDIYGHRAENFEKDMRFYGPDIFGNPAGLIRSNDISHARQRKLVSHAFSDRALKDQEILLKSYAELLVTKLKEQIGGEAKGKVNIMEWYNFTSFDIMADLTFGEPLQLLEKTEYTPWVRAFFANFKLIIMTSLLRQWPGMTTLLSYFTPKNIQELRKKHIANSMASVDKRLARKTDRPDIWTYVLKHSDRDDDSKRLQPSEMYSNAGLFMSAGTETTATELSGLTYMLLKNPSKLERLKREVRGAFSPFTDIQMGKLAQLPYLNAVIEEGLRIYPPVAQLLWRKVVNGGVKIDGHFVPKGMTVGVTQYSAFHSPEYFKDPDSFTPERFLPEGQKEYASDHRDVLQPFSYGPRNCLGKNLAYHEMRLILSTIILNFDMELCEDSEGWLDQKVFLIWEKPALMVRLRDARP